MKLMKKLFNIFKLIILTLLFSCSSSWKFEINQTEYSSFFPKAKRSEYLNADMMFYNNYFQNECSINSVYFPDDTSKTWINIEHLVKLVEEDLKILPGIDNANYLFSCVEFHKDLDIKEVKIQHEIDGVELSKVGSYIYNYHYNDNTQVNTYKSIDFKKGFIVKESSGISINDTNQFVFVNIYKMPISEFATKFIPRRFWFLKPGSETIHIKYKDGNQIISKSYHFKIKWTKRIRWVT